MTYIYYEDGTYLEVNATGAVYDIPGNCEALRIWCSNADAYVKVGSSTLAIAECKVPASSGDPCSGFVPNNTWVDIKTGSNTKIAIKSAGTTSKIWLIPCEARV